MARLQLARRRRPVLIVLIKGVNSSFLFIVQVNLEVLRGRHVCDVSVVHAKANFLFLLETLANHR